MTDYRPTPYMAQLAERLRTLTDQGRSLTHAEKREAQWIAGSIRRAKWHQARYQTDSAFRETRKARALAYWRAHSGSGVCA